MPTGYTDVVATGEVTDFSLFAQRCARAMMPLIHMRDDNLNEPINLRVIGTYHVKQLEIQQAKMQRLSSMSVAEADVQAERDYQDNMTRYMRRVEDMQIQRTRYEDMLTKARNWAPPTSEHESLKEFMVTQLLESLRHDIYPPEVPTLKSGIEWLNEETAEAAHYVDYHTKELTKERETCERANYWIQTMLDNLGVQL